MKRYAVDTGPLVALLNANDLHHAWATATFETMEPPLHTCEAVVSEACFLLRTSKGGPDAMLALLAKGVVVADFRLCAELAALRKLMTKYASVPMSVADACLVRMSELDSELTLVTLDADFGVYRRHGRQVIPVISP